MTLRAAALARLSSAVPGPAVLQEVGVGNSLAVQWLALGAFTAVARVQSLAGELRSRKQRGTAKKKKRKNKRGGYEDGCFYKTGLTMRSSHTYLRRYPPPPDSPVFFYLIPQASVYSLTAGQRTLAQTLASADTRFIKCRKA